MGPHEELQAALPRLDAWDGKEPEALDAFVRAGDRYVATTLSIFARATAGRRLQEVVTLLAHAGASRVKAHS